MEKIVLITGGSDGIGASTAVLAGQRGYTVCINYRQNEAGAAAVAAEVRKTGAACFTIQGDVSSEEDVVRMFLHIDKNVGQLTDLVNNAGIVETGMCVREMSRQRLMNVFSVNVIGSFLCAREAVKRMSVKTGGSGGNIVNVGSAASKHGSPFEYVDYASSKGAIDTMTLGLSKEVADEGIRVNAVRPGIIHTGIHAKGGDPGKIERKKDAIPMKRGGQPDEVARAILWLLSDEASYVTGALVDVSGGR